MTSNERAQIRAFLIRKEKETRKTYPIYKVCTVCKIEKPMVDFASVGKSKNRKDGSTRKSSRCRDCLAIISKKRNKREVTYYGVLEYEGGKRICRRCELEKPLSEFRKGGKKAGYAGGIRKISQCKPCEKIGRQAYLERLRNITIGKKKKETFPIFKVCKECRKEKYTLDFYFLPKRKDGTRTTRSTCKVCAPKPEHSDPKEYARKIKEKYWEDVGHSRKIKREWKNKQREYVTDWYVKHCLGYGKDIPKSLIYLKRELIILARLIKGKEEEHATESV